MPVSSEGVILSLKMYRKLNKKAILVILAAVGIILLTSEGVLAVGTLRDKKQDLRAIKTEARQNAANQKGEEGATTGSSTSQERACALVYKPVCGVNAKTYSNRCFAELDEVEVAHEGRCRIKDALAPSKKAPLDRLAPDERKAIKRSVRAYTGLREAREAFKEARLKGVRVSGEEVFSKTKFFLLALIDKIHNHLLLLKERAAGLPNLDQDAKEAIAAKVDQALSQLEELAGKVEAAETLAELKGLRRDIVKVWSSSKFISRQAAYRMIAARIGKLRERAELIKEKLNEAVDNHTGDLPEQLVSDLAELNALVATLKAQVGELRDLTSQLEQQHRDELVSSIRATIVTIKKTSREIAQLARSIAREVRSLADEQGSSQKGEVTTFAECASAGYPILQSYPRQCKTPDGTTFVEQTN